MSIRYSLSELLDSTNNRAEDFGYQVAQAARDVLCSAYQAIPNAVVPNPGNSFRRGAISALCSDRPPPPAPVSPFTGGQCQFQYNHRWTATSYPFNNCNASSPSGGSNGYWGPITGFTTFTEQVSTNVTGYFMRFSHHGLGGARQTTSVQTTIEYGRSAQGCPAATLNTNTFTPSGGQTDNCGNPPIRYPSPIRPAPQPEQRNITVEGDRTTTVTIDVSPTFEDDVCIGQFVFCADVEGNRLTFDMGGVTINLPGTGGGDQGGGGGLTPEQGDQITNIENITTNISNQQEECCDEILLAISQFRNRATELFNEAELRDACIVGLIRNSADKVPKFEEPISQRANGFSGLHGITRFVQPLRADSCFLIINIEPTETFRGRLYTLRDEGEDVEGGFGHCEIAFFDGGVRPAAEGGIRVLSATRTLITFPYVSSGNQIRLSLKGGLNYSVVDPGFRWRPGDLPQCEEIVDPTP